MPLTPSQERPAATAAPTPPHHTAPTFIGTYRVAINKPAWTHHWDLTGLATDYQRASAMSVDQGTYSRVLRGERAPTTDFLVRAREALRRITDTEVRIDDLIDVAETS